MFSLWFEKLWEVLSKFLGVLSFYIYISELPPLSFESYLLSAAERSLGDLKSLALLYSSKLFERSGSYSPPSILGSLGGFLITPPPPTLLPLDWAAKFDLES